ncbi:DUF1853 family protein [Portibacter lacus]|uniref:DUF1853 family protein n=1 Tax=Portibacter lacus TaxID=1099794 RepID=A0AA37WDX9_9BACT|nr:DUF1853 family protein [Portibacter lacus]GLR15600.1 hypothetical protein GCM10007940_02150 [Portibacter lacus]
MIKEQCIGFLNTPPLWEDNLFDIEQFDFPDLDMESFQPAVIPRNIRLGHQIEYVFMQLVTHSPNFDVMLHNLPICDEIRTVGEIDFILKDRKRNQLIHVELTYKFYIVDPAVAEPLHRLIGPNRRDKFVTKLEKIKKIQFPLLHTEAGAQALLERNIDHLDLVHQCCFKGQLFMPYLNSEIKIGGLNHDCVVGFWLRFAEFNDPEFADAEYYIPTKSEWVIEPSNQVPYQCHLEILKEVNARLLEGKAPLIWSKSKNNVFKKFFVV